MAEERRRGMDDLVAKVDSIIDKQGVIKSYIENQFGGQDLAGNATEGTITKQLRELNEKVKIQNGRVGKLEEKRAENVGKTELINLILSIVTVVSAVVTVVVIMYKK